MSTAQHLTDLALGLVERGHEVTVIASDRGYDNPENRFAKRETWRGITIIRIPSMSFGKQAKWRRALNFGSFLAVCAVRLLTMSRFDVTVSLTSPPLISFLGSLFVKLKGGKLVFWVMDLNPDEALAAGWLRQNSLTAKVLSGLLRYSLRHAEKIVVLDRFMRARILQKGIAEQKVVTIAPWSHSDSVSFDSAGRQVFRQEYGLSNKFVVMYSGNHSPCHPLDTLVQAAGKLAPNSDIAFAFVGGGSEQTKVRAYAQQHGLTNIICLPYQPLDKLAGSLSAADLHVVVMGAAFVGIVHPCKVYNILEVGAPFLYVGPSESHIVDLMSGTEKGTAFLSAQHGEVDRIAGYITACAAERKDARSVNAIAASFSRESLLPQMVKVLEAVGAGILSTQPAITDAGKQPVAQ